MDRFDITCGRCGTEIAVSVPHLRNVRPFTCPGCGDPLDVDDDGRVMPSPQYSTEESPAVQATILHFHGRSVKLRRDR